MRKIILLLFILFANKIEAQVNNKVTARDFKTFSDYRKFIKYKDSLNTLNKVNLDYEYLSDFKKIINTRDSINNLKEQILEKKLQDEYISGVELHKYIGTYKLSETKKTQFYSYPAKMYVTDSGISILPNNQLNEAIRFSYNFNIRKLIKNLKFESGQFFLYKKNEDSVIIINLESGVVGLSIEKTTYTFIISDFTKYEN